MLCFSGFELYSRWVPLNGKFKIQCFERQYTVFFPTQKKNMVRVIESKLYGNDLRGNKNYFELREVGVIEGKITVNV